MSALHAVAGVNIILGLIALCWLTLRTTRRWSEYPHEVRKNHGLMVALFIGLIAVSAEMYADDAALRTALLISAVKLYALWVLATTSTTKYRTGTRAADGNPGADQNRDVP